MDIDRVLSQIRTLRSQTGGIGEAMRGAAAAVGAPGAAGASGDDARTTVSFAAVLKGGLDQVNAAQQSARAAATAFERGQPGMDLPQVMLEMQKASVSFRGAVEVRNRLVAAYQEIMNMPV
jgi:flagellar hook-basal body complex protein FliE